jgi:hypothetical protein
MAINQALSGGGLQLPNSGTIVLTDNGNNAGTAFAPVAITTDSKGLVTQNYSEWNTGLTYPVGAITKGSNKLHYVAISAQAGNNPTTDAGVHWRPVNLPTVGTTSQTLRFNGTNYVGSSILLNDGTSLTIGGNTDAGSFKITTTYIPVNGPDLVNKTYADGIAVGITDGHVAVTTVATTNITLSGEQTISGVLTSASRVGVVGQTAGAENGIYDTGAGAWTRATDMDATGEVIKGSYFFVTSGTKAGAGYLCTTSGTITMDVTAQVWIQLSGTISLVAGTGISVSGLTVNAIYDDSTIGINGSNQLIVKTGGITATELASTGVTAAAYHYGAKVTLDVDGRATAATDTTGTFDADHFLNGLGAFSAININQITNGGTVTSFSAGDLSPLFTTTEANVTTTPALTFVLTDAAQNALFAGPASGGSGAPTYRAMKPLDIATAPLAGKILYATSATAMAWSGAGADQNTLRFNGTVPTPDGFLLNSGTQVGINALPATGILFGVAGTGGTTPVTRFAATVSGNPAIMNVYNTANSNGADVAVVGTAGDFWTGTAQNDAVFRQSGGSGNLWLGIASTAIAKFASADLGANKFLACPDGSGGNLSVRSIVAADVPNLGLTKISSGGVAGKILYDNATNIVESAAGSDGQTIRFNGTVPTPNSVMTNDGTGITITPTSTNKALTLTAAGATPALDISNTTTDLLYATSSLAMGSSSGATMVLASSTAASTSDQRYGSLQWSKNISGTYTNIASISVNSEEDNTTNLGAKMRFTVGTLAAATRTTRMEIRGNGDIVLQAKGSENTTGTTGGFTQFPTCNGIPTGTPANAITGTVPMIVNRAGNRLMAYLSSAWVDITTPPLVALTDAATIALDASLGKEFTVTLGGNRTLGAPTNPTDGQKIIVRVKQDGTGSRTLAYNAIYRFSTDVPSPTLTTTAAKTDYLGFIYNATDSKWDCLAVNKGF